MGYRFGRWLAGRGGHLCLKWQKPLPTVHDLAQAGSELPDPPRSKPAGLDLEPVSFQVSPTDAAPLTQQIAVPETLLKKRKSTDKTREDKLAKAAEAKKVRPFSRLATARL